MTKRRLTRALSQSLDVAAEDIAAILDCIRILAQHDPTMLEELFPGKRLVDKPMSNRQAIALAAKAAAQRSKSKAQDRHALVWPFIKKMLDKDPDVSLGAIAKALNASRFKPLRSNVWNKSSILFIINKAKENDQANEPEEARIRGGELSGRDGETVRDR